MYKINVYERDGNNKMVLSDDDYRRYEYKKDAKAALLDDMISTLNIMVDISHQQKLYTNNFTLHQNVTENEKFYDGVIRQWNIPANINGILYFAYEIIWVNESPEDKYNKMLKDTHGESLTLWVRPSEKDCTRDDEEECDGDCEHCTHCQPQYYYEGATCGRSRLYRTPEEAYKEANDYMNNIDLYVD